MHFIIDTVSANLDKYGIQMEDPCIVSLNLILTIMYYRIISGHFLAYGPVIPKTDPEVLGAANDILDAMENHLEFFVGPEERDQIYLQIRDHRILSQKGQRGTPAEEVFGPRTLECGNEYIRRIRETFQMDFSDDPDFCNTLFHYIQTLVRGHHTFYEQFSADQVKRHHRIEMVIAELFQPLAKQYLGEPLNEVRLIYLSYIVAGGLDHFIKHHPGNKIRTVIACHMNMPVSWALMRKARFHFGDYIEIVDILPVYRKNTYDFTDVDLVLTTVQKRITDDPGTTTLYISQFFDETDQEEISHYIMTKTLKPLYSRDVSLTALLRSTWWHQQENFSDPKDLLHRVTQEFIDRDIEDEAYQKDILEREQITSFSIFPGVVFLYSFVPAKRSQISVTTLDHRITWNGNKIRIVVAAAFTQEDMPAILRLTNFLYEDAYNVDVVKNMKTKEEILKYVQGSPQFFLNHS